MASLLFLGSGVGDIEPAAGSERVVDMHARIRPVLVGSVAAMTINAFAATAVAPAAPGPGGLPVRVVRNQLQYCSLICPFVLQGAATVPLAIGTAPLTFTDALLSSASLVQAAGAAAASVTGPARAAADPIITNDLSLVLPKAQNALEVSAVELINVGFASGRPRGVGAGHRRCAHQHRGRSGSTCGRTGWSDGRGQPTAGGRRRGGQRRVRGCIPGHRGRSARRRRNRR